MKFAYTIWTSKHYREIDNIIDAMKDNIDYFILTTMPALFADNEPMFIENGLDGSHLPDWPGRDVVKSAFDKCKSAGVKTGIQIIPTANHARDKKPEWWQGYIDFGNNEIRWFRFEEEFLDCINEHQEIFENSDFWILGAELTSTLYHQDLWEAIITISKAMLKAPVSYSHHFSMPLKLYYHRQLWWMIFFGHLGYWMLRKSGEQIYADVLAQLLDDRFSIPENQLVEVGKNLWQAPNINQADMDFIKLNDYFYYVMNKVYAEPMLRERWEYINMGSYSVKFMPAVRKWVEKYKLGREVWIENDVTALGLNVSDEYYQLWWDVFISKHAFADVLVCWNSNWRQFARMLSYLR